jgi:5'-3' exonuclease
MKKTFFEKPDYDYAMWKSLKGDSCDNIKGIPGIGEKRAEILINDPDALGFFFKENQSAVNIFNENYSLIKFRDWTKEEFDMLDEHVGQGTVETAKKLFDNMAFSSITKEKTWQKYVDTFKSMIDS